MGPPREVRMFPLRPDLTCPGRVVSALGFAFRSNPDRGNRGKPPIAGGKPRLGGRFPEMFHVTDGARTRVLDGPGLGF